MELYPGVAWETDHSNTWMHLEVEQTIETNET